MERRKLATISHSDPLYVNGLYTVQEITGLLIILKKEFVISISMYVLNHFVYFIFQCPSFMLWRFSGTRSLHRAGLHIAKFILHWMTNCI